MRDLTVFSGVLLRVHSKVNNWQNVRPPSISPALAFTYRPSTIAGKSLSWAT